MATAVSTSVHAVMRMTGRWPRRLPRPPRRAGAGSMFLLAERPQELGHVDQVLDAPGQDEDGIRRFTGQAGPGGAVAELVGELAVGHRAGGAALAEVGAAGDALAVLELDLDDGRHLVEAGRFGLGMDAEV